MTKKDLIELVARKAHLTKKASGEAVDTFLNEISRALIKGEKVIVSGFGTFDVVRRKEKVMYLRGKEEKVSSHLVASFKVGKTLRRKIKG